MSFIKIQHIVSVSSEDKNFPAENLLKDGEYKKWKCEKGGQKQASVVMQFEKASKIHSVDIGNEGSAFVEVLVGRLSDNEQNYQVFLVASSFMSPKESQDGTNSNRVRIFGSDKFTKELADEKWDRVKIVCTQPFNKTAQYGLAFVKFHSTSESSQTKQSEKTPPSSKVQRMGSFTLKSDADDSSSLVPGSLFSKRKDASPLKAALEIRAASSKAEADLLTSKPAQSMVTSKRKIFASDDTEPDTKKAFYESSAEKKDAGSTNKPSSPSSTKLPTAEKPPSSKEKQKPSKVGESLVPLGSKENKGKPAIAASVPFKKLMAGVVFALSGFQNPHRGELRDRALEMGAKYRPDWDDTCTHLICAFPNTPKFQQVKSAGGKIVSKQWILDCHKQKVALPSQKYKLISRSSSDTDDDNDNDRKDIRSKPRDENKPRKADVVKIQPDKTQAENDDDYGGSTDVESSPSGGKSSVKCFDSDTDYDTEEEIRRAMKDGNEDAIVDTSEMPLPELPDYFHGSAFFLYGDFEPDEKRTLVRYIVAFNGQMEEYMNKKVAYVITKAEWDENFEEALSSNENLIFVKPKWIHTCAEKKKGVPHQPYIVVPKE